MCPGLVNTIVNTTAYCLGVLLRSFFAFYGLLSGTGFHRSRLVGQISAQVPRLPDTGSCLHITWASIGL